MEQIEKDKLRYQAIDKHTNELIKSLEVFKRIDDLNADMKAEQAEQRSKIRYIQREEDPVMKKAYEEEKHRYETLHETLKDQLDG
jgi:hypothetical protein